MAIQERRGNHADFDPSKLVAGEPFICLDKVDGQYFAGIAVAPNQFMRLGDYDEVLDVRTDCEQYRDEAHTSATNAAISETNSENSSLDSEAWAVGQRDGTDVPSTDPTYENNSKYYSEQSGTYWGYVHDAIDFVVPTITMNWTTGQLEADGTSWWFGLNQTTGQLEWAVSHA